MEVTLQELIDSIKKDGVETAEKRAEEIIKTAEFKAEELLRKAKKEAEALKDQADKYAVKKEQSSQATIQQAGRDLLLSLQGRITMIFDTLLEKQVSSELQDKKTLRELILKVLQADIISGSDGVLEVSPDQIKTIEKIVMKDLAAELKSGYVIKPVKGIDAGFRYSESDGSGHFDITTEMIAEMIGKFVNPELQKVIGEAAAKGE